MAERELATVRIIDEILPIEGADAIEAAVLGGWTVVIRKGEYKTGDLVIYAEVDSWIPTDLAPFLSKGKEPREFNGVKGEKLRTIRLRGQISQGLLLPLSIRGQVFEAITVTAFEGMDLTDELHIQKWEAPINPNTAGLSKGNFPSIIPKTDQSRVQNLKRELSKWENMNLTWEESEKLEGTSLTVYMPIEGDMEVCSRNINLKRDETNLYWKVAIENDIETKLNALGIRGIAIQGEIIGEGVEGNIYKLKGHQLRVFDIYDVKKGNYLNSAERLDLISKLGLESVPILVPSTTISYNMQELVASGEGKSVILPTQEREGVVYKCIERPELSFKSISNRYLEKLK